MALEKSIEHVASLMHTLTTQDVIDNTFGLITAIKRGLSMILADLAHEPAGGQLTADVAARLRGLVTDIDDKRALFAIPERWLINDVLSSARTIRSRLDSPGAGPAAG